MCISMISLKSQHLVVRNTSFRIKLHSFKDNLMLCNYIYLFTSKHHFQNTCVGMTKVVILRILELVQLRWISLLLTSILGLKCGDLNVDIFDNLMTFKMASY